MTATKHVPHLPWAPSEGVTINVPMGHFVPPVAGDFAFWRAAHPLGSFTAHVRCYGCTETWEAGASAGERKLVRWARDHVCNKPQAEFVDEDQRLFR